LGFLFAARKGFKMPNPKTDRAIRHLVEQTILDRDVAELIIDYLNTLENRIYELEGKVEQIMPTLS